MKRLRKKPKFTLQLQYNSPVILTFFLLSLGVLFLGQWTGGWTTTHLFCVYRSSLKDPLFYVRLFGHVLGHGSWDHFLNNMLLLLVIGPPMEEKYGSIPLLRGILLTALISGILQCALFPHSALLGASGIVFMLIMLASLSGFSGGIPVTMLLVAVLYLGQQVYDVIFVRDNVANFHAHRGRRVRYGVRLHLCRVPPAEKVPPQISASKKSVCSCHRTGMCTRFSEPEKSVILAVRTKSSKQWGGSSMKLEKVAVLGAGAVGAYILWGLSEKPGIRLGVVAEGERARRLQNGIGINGKVYHPEVWTPEEAHEADLLIVALKYGALPGALDSIRQVVGEHTIVMSLMNGVDSEEILAAEVGADHLLYSLIKVVSHKEADGFRFDPDATLGIIYGEMAAPFESERVQAVAALFEGTGVRFRVTEHIREEMWSKFRLNVCNNLPQAILGAGVGCYRDSVHMKAISDGLRKELMAIAAAKGIDLSIVDKTPAGAVRCRRTPGTPPCRTSTPGGIQRSTCSPGH